MSDTVIERVQGVSRVQLRDEYIAKSRPVIITDAVDRWPALKNWSLDYFERGFADRIVNAPGGAKTRLGDAVQKIRESSGDGKPAPYIHQIPIPLQLPELLTDLQPLLTFVEQDRMASRLMPHSFRFPRGNLELFIGGPGAGFGLLHYDIYHLHAFTIQLLGHKSFRLFSPADTEFLYANPSHPHTSTLPNAFAVDLGQHPAFARATPIDIVLGPHETLFVPSGWWHTTKMSEVTISVAYNTLDMHNWSDFVHDYQRGVVEVDRTGLWGRLRATYLKSLGAVFLARGM